MLLDAFKCDCTLMQPQQQHQPSNCQLPRQKQRQHQTQQLQCSENEAYASNISSRSRRAKNRSKRRRKLSIATQIKNEKNSTNYCNFNKINRLLITIGVLLITLTTTTTTTAMAAVVSKTTLSATMAMTIPLLAPTTLIGGMTMATAAIPASSPLSPVQQQQRQLQQQQLFALLTKNRHDTAGGTITAGGIGAGGSDLTRDEVGTSSVVAAEFVRTKHLLDLDAATMPDDAVDNVDSSLETAGFVADDGQRYEKAVKALAAAASSKNNGNNNDSNGNGHSLGVGVPSDCPRECKCLDAYFDCGDQLLVRVPPLPGYVHTLDFVGNKLNDTTVLQIRNLTELIKLTLKRNQLESVPVFSGLNALKQLNLANNHIQRISSAALEALPRLKTLDVSRNFLHTMDSSYFPPNNRLAHLILNSNEISSIDEDAFLHLGDLLDLELNNNRLMTLQAGVFHMLHKLRKLSLNNNHLEINWSTFRGLSSLQKLFLKSNNIRTLQDGVFYVMHAIETIELDHNGITSLSRQGLFNLTKLHHLSLSNNSISRIEPDTWEFTQSLISLDLSHNNISEFRPQHLDCLKRLRHLNLGHNKIQYLADNTFDCVKNLEDLNLRRNKLAWIIEDPGATSAFKALRKLKKLDLYGNNLKQIMSKSLSGLGTLESLNLGGNALATIQSGALDHMPHLQKLSFKSLNFICDCELLWFQRWLRHNEQSTTGTQVQSENAVCGYPEHLFDRQLVTLTTNELVCADSPKPTIIHEPSTQLTVKGANITMECVGNSPAAASLAAADELKIKWRHDNQNIRERERGHFFAPHHSGAAGGGSYSTTETQIHHDDTTNQSTIIGYLRLYNVSYANAGRYQCVVSNAFGTTYSQKFKISIGIHPTFLQIPSNLTIDSGDTARLVCSATGDPVPEIALQKFGGSDFPAATERRLQVLREENAFIITNAKPIDTGVYTCTAESAAGEIKINATLVVNDKPQPNIPLAHKETVVGESSVLQCLSDFAADLSQPHREWFKDNKPFHLGTLSADTERYFLTSEHELLVIVNTQSVDAGLYRCEISDNSKTYTVQTELIVVKEELSQNVIIIGVVIVAVLCILSVAMVIFALLLHQRRKAFRRRRDARQNTHSSSGGPSGLLSGSVGIGVSAATGGGARVASTSTQLLSGSRGSALDQTQLTTLNRSFLEKPLPDAARQRPCSVGDIGINATITGEGGGGGESTVRPHNDAYDVDDNVRQNQRLTNTPTPNYKHLLKQHDERNIEADDEHLTLTYLKRRSLPDSAGVGGDHNQDHLSSKDSGTGSDTAVKRSIDDFTLTTLLSPANANTQQSQDCAATPVNAYIPHARHVYNGHHHSGDVNSYPTDDGGDIDEADLLYAATHALGVSECDVELLEFDRYRATAMLSNKGDNHAEIETDADAVDERTHFLYQNNFHDKSHLRNADSKTQPYEPLPTMSKLRYPIYNCNGSNFSHNQFDSGGGTGRGRTAPSSNCKANLSTNATSAAVHAQAVDI